MNTITISVDNISLTAELNDTPTAQAIWDALPLSAAANVWGDEIYFGIPVQLDEAPDARADVEVGTLAYWPPGNAFCIFYGRTPASSDSQPRAASPVNIFGRILDDATQLRGTRSGVTVRIERSETS